MWRAKRSESTYCTNCGTNIEDIPITEKEETFLEKNKLPLIIIGATALFVILFLAISPSAISNEAIFHIEGEPSQTVDVDGIFIKIPQEFRLSPESIDISYQNSVMSSSKGWKHETEFISLAVMRINAPNVNYNEAAGIYGGEHRNMCGHDGYYIENENGYSFIFTKDNKVCVIMVTSPYLFDKIIIT